MNPEVYDRILTKCELVYGRTYNFVLSTYLNAVTTRINERQKPSKLEDKAQTPNLSLTR